MPVKRHLLMRLEAPLMSFGGEAIDNRGMIREFPALSLVTGLIANALGWDRADADRHARLQARIRMGCRIDRAGVLRTDFQTAKLEKEDRGWTTLGMPEGRDGGVGTYESPHLRYRDYHCDASTLVALRLEPDDETPSLDEIAAALDRPVRPLFIGRKTCLPAARLFERIVFATNVSAALDPAAVDQPDASAAAPEQFSDRPAWWTEGEGEGDRITMVCDERNWRSGVHGGMRPVVQGRVRPKSRS